MNVRYLYEKDVTGDRLADDELVYLYNYFNLIAELLLDLGPDYHLIGVGAMRRVLNLGDKILARGISVDTDRCKADENTHFTFSCNFFAGSDTNDPYSITGEQLRDGLLDIILNAGNIQLVKHCKYVDPSSIV